MLVVVDEPLRDLGERLRHAAQSAGADAVLAVMDRARRPRRRAAAPVAAALAACDVFIAPTSRSLSHTQRAQGARRTAAPAARRCRASPSDMLARLMASTSTTLRERSRGGRRSCSTDADEAHVTCPRGTRPARSTCAAARASPTTATSRRPARSATCRAARASSRRPGGEGTIVAALRWPRSASSTASRARLTVRDGALADATGPEGERLLETLRAHGGGGDEPRRARRRHQRARDADRQRPRGREDPRHASTSRSARARASAARCRCPSTSTSSCSTRRSRSAAPGARRRAASCSDHVLLARPQRLRGARRGASLDAVGAAFAAGGARVARRPRRPRPQPRRVHARRRRPGALAARAARGRARGRRRASTCAATRASHPHVGALDVAPVVHLDAAARGAACAEALVARRRARRELGAARLPLRRARAAAARARSCAAAAGDGSRRRMRRRAAPGLRPAAPHPTAGATLVAARPPLVAFNLELARAGDARRRDAPSPPRSARAAPQGLPGVRAHRPELAAARRRRAGLLQHRGPRARAARRGRRGGRSATRRSPRPSSSASPRAAAFDGFPTDVRDPQPARPSRG